MKRFRVWFAVTCASLLVAAGCRTPATAISLPPVPLSVTAPELLALEGARVAGIHRLRAQRQPEVRISFTERGLTDWYSSRTMFVIDGRVTVPDSAASDPLAVLRQLRPEDVRSICVLKGDEARAQAGAADVEHVVVITTRPTGDSMSIRSVDGGAVSQPRSAC